MRSNARTSLALLVLPLLAFSGCRAGAKAEAPTPAPAKAASARHLTIVLTASNWGEVDPCG